MQTFLPYADFAESARVLDRQRLGKQRVETLQVLQALLQHRVADVDGRLEVVPARVGWDNHSVTRMWRGHESGLLAYQFAVCDEWTSRGYRDTCRAKTRALFLHCSPSSTPPEWLGDEELHASHRSNLLRKAPEFYAQWGWTEPDDLPYKWPVYTLVTT